ncbi:MAG: tetratricopeptide repeat protein, partial [Isosphaeraceae bacterium]
EIAADAGRRAEAVELFRLAACFDAKDEGLARSYFHAARLLHRQAEAVAFLRGRSRRLGTRSAWPARTLYWSLCQLERRREAFEVLDESLRLRPEDGELRLFAAEAHAAHGEFDRAEERLESARGLSRRGDWLRASALLAAVRGDLGASLELWLQVLDSEPSAVDANRAVARRLAETRCRDEALAHLARACEQFPHNYALNQAWIEWLRAEGPSAVEPAARRILEIHPADAWSRRELALSLARQGRHDEAAAEVRLAAELEPGSPAEAAVRAQVFELAGRLDDARRAYRDAIARSVDMDFAIDHLIACCASRAERVEALAFVEAELHRQVIFGDGLLAFARHARGTVEPDALLASLRKAREARPDLWHAWSALVHELVGRDSLDEALELAREATERFPLLAEVWLDLAAVCRAHKDRDGELAALDRTLQISPGHGTAARQRAMVLERDGDYVGSRAVLERAIAQAPLDPFNHTCLADALWHLDERDQAVDRIVHALRLEPDQDWAWDTLRHWSAQLDRREIPVSLARELAEQRAGKASNWVRLARLLAGEENLEERLDALDRAVTLEPADFEAHDLRAQLLTEAGRYDEAEAACRPLAWGDSPPTPLLGRSAWVVAQRGDLAGAIGRMRPVLEANPDYYWGWLNQAEWTGDVGTPAEYLAAAEALTRLSPNDPVAAGYLGDARLRNKDRDGARAAFRGAFDRTPRHPYTAFSLFDLEFEDGQLQTAAEVLKSLKTHHDGALTLAREVQLAQARGDRATAVAALERLCVTALPGNDWPQNAADKCFTQAGWSREAIEVYERALDHPDLVPRVAALWVERRMAGARRGCARRLGALLEQGERGFVALEAYLNRLAREKSKLRLLGVMRRHGAAIRANTRCWGTLGFTLTSVAWNGRAARWLADWRDRHDAHPWMLINLALALRGLGRVDAANQVSRRALELPPDYTVPYHRIWLALDNLIDGDGRQAAALLEHHDPERYDATNQYLLTLARLLLERAQAAPEERRAVLRSTGRRLFRFCLGKRIPREDYGAVAWTYYRVVRRMSADRNPITGVIWRVACSIATPIRVG